MFQCSDRWRGAGFSFVTDEGTARLMDILLFGPLLIATGFAVPDMPKAMRWSLVAAGSFVVLWNGIGYLAVKNESLRRKHLAELRADTDALEARLEEVRGEETPPPPGPEERK